MITVAGYIAKFLKQKGVRHIFGFQGSAMLKMLDEIVGYGIEYIQNFNEQPSGFAADAYARVNGIGAAIATSGPGAVNLIGGIANAYFDSVPVIFITGQDYKDAVTADNGARQNGFQDMDIVSMVKPVTKYAVLLDKPENVRYELEKAHYLATNGRNGSVLIDVPIDIQFKEVDENSLNGFVPPEEKIYDYKTEEIISALKKSERPLILAGGGIRRANAIKEFRQFVENSRIPVITTLNGLDAIPQAVGFAGIYGNPEARLASLNTDLLLVLGARFARQHTGKKREEFLNPNAKVIHVDIDETEINRTFIKEDISVIADLKGFLTELNKQDFNLNTDEWKKCISKWKEEYKDSIKFNNKGLCPIDLVRTVAENAPHKCVITADVGANQMWVAQGFTVSEEQQILNSAGFGAMGYSLPAAIGGSYVVPNVICFTGDGGLQMNLQELNTLSLRQNNVKCFVFNNNNLGLMRNLQKTYYNNHFYGNNEKEFTCPDIKKLADAFTLNYTKISTEKDLRKIKDVFKDNKPWLIDVVIDKDTTPLNRYNGG